MEKQLPFLAFVVKLSKDASALNAFVDDPSTAPVTAAQRAALLSGQWAPIEAELRAEDPAITIASESPAAEFLAVRGGAKSGWVLHGVARAVALREAKNRKRGAKGHQ